MATITISDDTLEFLQTFVKRINTQDNRGTASPYVYAIRDTYRVYGIDDNNTSNGQVWYNSNDGTVFNTDEELLAELSDNPKSCVEDVADEHGYEYTSYKEIRVIKNIFFTEKSAIEHLESCHYHYNDPDIR